MIFYWTIITLFLLLLYCTSLVVLYISLRKGLSGPFSISYSTPFVSVVVIARNEENKLPHLLNSIQMLDYPSDRMEVVFVNDNSEDTTEILLKAFKVNSNCEVQILALDPDSRSNHKKRGIELALKHCKANIIALTDADCVLPSSWLKGIVNSFKNEEIKLVAGPVKLRPRENAGLLYFFEEMDWVVLQTITAAAIYAGKPVMCNGANLAFRKEAFNDAGGYKGNKGASGDDVFLLLKIKELYSSEAINWNCSEEMVQTFSNMSFREFLYQRLRWASKSKYYSDKDVLWLGIIITLTNLCILTGLVFSFFSIILAKVLLPLWLIKAAIDWLILSTGSSLYKTKTSIGLFWLFEFIYPFYSIGIAFISLIINPVWKGRKVK